MATKCRITKTGDSFSHNLNLIEPTNVAALFAPLGLTGLRVFAEVRTQSGRLLHTSPELVLNDQDTMVTLTVPNTATINWEVGSTVLMDFLFTNGTPTGSKHTRTIYIDVQKGITQLADIVPGEGGWSRMGFGPGFNLGPAGS
ncbi:MAG: hypothetical protein K0U41_07435 [Gammaproteobacteria bacterium]|nr:hypothetical protein [Gammaproteobacteria bacterium]